MQSFQLISSIEYSQFPADKITLFTENQYCQLLPIILII